MTAMTSPEKQPAKTRCTAQVSQGWSGFAACGKPVKRDGMCGVHANAMDKRKAGKDAAVVRQRAMDETQLVAQAVSEITGLTITPRRDRDRPELVTVDVHELYAYVLEQELKRTTT
jgi:hypothetical protein